MEEFKKYNFEQDKKWELYFANLTFPENLSPEQKSKTILKFKYKFYRKNVDTSLPEEIPESLLSSSAGGSSTPTKFKSCYNLVTIPPLAKHTATIIFLHGLGDSGDGWADLFFSMQSSMQHVKVICPSALNKKVTLNYGMSMPAWYDIKGLTPEAGEDEVGIQETLKNVTDIIENEIKNGIPSNRIVLGGFSQGGSIALTLGLRYKETLAGILGLSTFLCLRSSLEKELSDANAKTPLLMCHGDIDNVVRYNWGLSSFEAIKQMREKKSVSSSASVFNTYKGLGHSGSPVELKDVAKWLHTVIPQN